MNTSEWWRWVAHNHWVAISPYGRSLRICSRCLGVMLGFTLLLVFTFFFEFSFFYSMHLHYQLSICVILASPAIYDWLTQRWRLRESSNKLRVSTGILEGSGVALLSLATISTISKITFFLFIMICVLNLEILGKKFIKHR